MREDSIKAPNEEMDESNVLAFIDVCFAYDREEVLHNVRFEVPSGSLVAVVGPNGGGKSTLMRLALGLLQPRCGIIRVLGRSPQQASSHVGYVPQHLSFDAAFPVSALDVVLMGRADRHLFGSYRKDDRTAARGALRKVGLEEYARRGFSELSGGERQRVLIAQALVADPQLMLLDEPTANVDVEIERHIYSLLNDLAKTMTIIVVSHNLNVVTRHATHIACVNRTVSLLPMSSWSDDHLKALKQGDMTMLQHGSHCQVIDPSHGLKEPHRGMHSTSEAGL